MSTLAPLPPIIPTAALVVSMRPESARDDQRITIRDIPWDIYDRLSQAVGEDQHVRLAYDGKDLEIMTTGLEHEDYKHWLTLFLETVMTACRIRGRLGSQATWKRAGLERGLEADQCAWFDPEKVATVKRLRAAGVKDLDRYPNPELAIEIDVSPAQIDRPGIYAALEVAEIWRFDGNTVVIEQLGPDGKYAAVDRSRFVPVTPSDILPWLTAEDAGELEWKERMAEWAAGLADGEVR
jgi:Uma2 family endonuclease